MNNINYYGPDDVRVWLDDASGTPVDISKVIVSIGDVGVEAKLVDEAQGFGEAWVRALAIGVRMIKEVPLEVWLTSPNAGAAAGSIEAVGTRALLKGVVATPRDRTRTLRVEYGEPVPAVAAVNATIEASDQDAGDTTVTLAAAAPAGIAVGDYVSISGEAYRVTAVNGAVLTLHRGLLQTASGGSTVTKITAYFGECETLLRDSGPSLDRSNASMIKTALRPTGELVEN